MSSAMFSGAFSYAAGLIGLFLLCFALAWALSVKVLRYLLAQQILDMPSERSSHSRPTPRGGGWALMLVALPALAAVGLLSGDMGRMVPLLVGTAGLMAVSWMDDRRDLSPLVRLGVQAAAVALGLLSLPADLTVWQGLLPGWADRALTALLWLWFINLYNFMDGIDGLAGSETMLIGAGIALVCLVAGEFGTAGLLGAALAGAAGGFLTHNWRPARMFMGDVGSVPLGFLLGFLLVTLAASGYWVAALLLPAYYLADATITLTRRALRGEKIWRAHREHFYQKAAIGAGRHDRVVLTIVGYGLGLLGAALASLTVGPAMLAVGTALVAALLLTLVRMAKA